MSNQRILLAAAFPVLTIYYCLVAIVKLFTPNRLLKEKDIKANDIVLITGAGMGIGREMAKQFVERGCRKLIIWDVKEVEMEESKAILQALGCKVWTYKVDVTNYQEVMATADTVKLAVGTVTYLVNNAGVVAGKPILELTPEQVNGVIGVNCVSHFWTVQAFLPGMLHEKNGHIVTIASVVGLMGIPFISEYCASKFAAIGFHDSLRFELQYLPAGENIQTTVVCPWAISTGMFSGIDAGLLPFLTPEYVANAVLDAVLANRNFLVIPFSLRLTAAIMSLLPHAVLNLLLRIVGDPATAKHLIGRKTFD